MGLVVGMFAEKKPIKNYVLNAIVAILLAIGIKVGGYYIAEGIDVYKRQSYVRRIRIYTS